MDIPSAPVEGTFELIMYGVPIIFGVVIAVALVKYKAGWLAYLAGVALQFVFVWYFCRYFLFFGQSEICSYAIYFSIRNAIIGLIAVIVCRLLLAAILKKIKPQSSDDNEAQAEAQVAHDPSDWLCANCGLFNPSQKAFCTNCGVSKKWSEEKLSKKSRHH